MELRPELMPPALDEARVARLARLADRLDGCPRGEGDIVVEAFNREAGTDFAWLDFQGISGGMEPETWVRATLSFPAARAIPDITDDELLELIRRVTTAGGAEHEVIFWLKLLEANLPDPRLSDLLYWPGEYFGDGDNTRVLTPRQILETARAAGTGHP